MPKAKQEHNKFPSLQNQDKQAQGKCPKLKPSSRPLQVQVWDKFKPGSRQVLKPKAKQERNKFSSLQVQHKQAQGKFPNLKPSSRPWQVQVWDK